MYLNCLTLFRMRHGVLGSLWYCQPPRSSTELGGKSPLDLWTQPDYRNPPRCKPCPMSRLYTMEWHGTASEVSPVMGCWREVRGLGLSETQHKRRRTPATVRPSPCGPRECRLSCAPRFFFRAIGNNCGKWKWGKWKYWEAGWGWPPSNVRPGWLRKTVPAPTWLPFLGHGHVRRRRRGYSCNGAPPWQLGIFGICLCICICICICICNLFVFKRREDTRIRITEE